MWVRFLGKLLFDVTRGNEHPNGLIVFRQNDSTGDEIGIIGVRIVSKIVDVDARYDLLHRHVVHQEERDKVLAEIKGVIRVDHLDMTIGKEFENEKICDLPCIGNLLQPLLHLLRGFLRHVFRQPQKVLDIGEHHFRTRLQKVDFSFFEACRLSQVRFGVIDGIEIAGAHDDKGIH